MKAFHIDIVTPDGIEYDGEVESLLVRTDDGDENGGGKTSVRKYRKCQRYRR